MLFRIGFQVHSISSQRRSADLCLAALFARLHGIAQHLLDTIISAGTAQLDTDAASPYGQVLCRPRAAKVSGCSTLAVAMNSGAVLNLKARYHVGSETLEAG